MRVSLVHAYVHRPDPVLAHFFGSAQLLPGGGVFVGWGGSPYVTEFDRSGAIVFDARLPRAGQSYRAFRFPWAGRPADRPAAAVQDGKLYASWNGATQVASWQLREDGRSGSTFPRTGFETALPLAPRTRTAEVSALDAKGASLGASSTVRVA
jgi:hypothetical protein